MILLKTHQHLIEEIRQRCRQSIDTEVEGLVSPKEAEFFQCHQQVERKTCIGSCSRIKQAGKLIFGEILAAICKMHPDKAFSVRFWKRRNLQNMIGRGPLLQPVKAVA
jgi:hypothetical protein